jgi:hypothetical protein
MPAMKKWMLLLALLPSFAFAQECKIRKEIDQFSQLPKLTSGMVKFDTDVPFQLSTDATKTDITLLFLVKNSGDSKCFDDESTLVLTFEGNKSKQTLRNNGPMNCDGYFHLNYRNSATSTQMKRLTTQKITSMTFISGKTQTIINLNEQQRAQLQTMMSCISTQAPTLLTQ